MLILTRKLDEEIRINDDITIKVVRLNGNQVAIGIEAPKEVSIHRQEVYQRLFSEQQQDSQEEQKTLSAYTEPRPTLRCA